MASAVLNRIPFNSTTHGGVAPNSVEAQKVPSGSWLDLDRRRMVRQCSQSPDSVSSQDGYGDSSDNLSSDDELRYGPGFVSRLKSKFIQRAASNGTTVRAVLMRPSSFEDLPSLVPVIDPPVTMALQHSKPDEVVSSNRESRLKARPAQHTASSLRPQTRARPICKRAQSVEVLSVAEEIRNRKSHLPPDSNHVAKTVAPDVRLRLPTESAFSDWRTEWARRREKRLEPTVKITVPDKQDLSTPDLVYKSPVLQHRAVVSETRKLFESGLNSASAPNLCRPFIFGMQSKRPPESPRPVLPTKPAFVVPKLKSVVRVSSEAPPLPPPLTTTTTNDSTASTEGISEGIPASNKRPPVQLPPKKAKIGVIRPMVASNVPSNAPHLTDLHQSAVETSPPPIPAKRQQSHHAKSSSAVHTQPDVPNGSNDGSDQKNVSPPSQPSSVVFNFSNSSKDVTHIENDGLDLSDRRRPATNDALSQASGHEDAEDTADVSDRPVSPCDVHFTGAGIVVNDGSCRRSSRGNIGSKRRNSTDKNSITFSDKLVDIFEYPSYETLVKHFDSMLQSEGPPVNDDRDVVDNAIEIDRPLGKLSSYRPANMVMHSDPFQLGVTRSADQIAMAATTTTTKQCTDESRAINALGDLSGVIPLAKSQSWSNSSDSVDILF